MSSSVLFLFLRYTRVIVLEIEPNLKSVQSSLQLLCQILRLSYEKYMKGFISINNDCENLLIQFSLVSLSVEVNLVLIFRSAGLKIGIVRLTQRSILFSSLEQRKCKQSLLYAYTDFLIS